MIVVHVFIHVKQEYIEDFIQATVHNAENSVKEPGIARFDIIQGEADPTRFVLVEIYRSQDDPSKHKETQHYKKWRLDVEKMMAEPRSSIKYRNIFPEDDGWG